MRKKDTRPKSNQTILVNGIPVNKKDWSRGQTVAQCLHLRIVMRGRGTMDALAKREKKIDALKQAKDTPALKKALTRKYGRNVAPSVKGMWKGQMPMRAKLNKPSGQPARNIGTFKREP